MILQNLLGFFTWNHDLPSTCHPCSNLLQSSRSPQGDTKHVVLGGARDLDSLMIFFIFPWLNPPWQGNLLVSRPLFDSTNHGWTRSNLADPTAFPSSPPLCQRTAPAPFLFLACFSWVLTLEEVCLRRWWLWIWPSTVGGALSLVASLDALLWRLSVPGVVISRGHAFYFRFVSLFHGSYSLSSAAVSKKILPCCVCKGEY
jgi:hypothetical protein